MVSHSSVFSSISDCELPVLMFLNFCQSYDMSPFKDSDDEDDDDFEEQQESRRRLKFVPSWARYVLTYQFPSE
jgi:hypothetical protein